MTRLAEAVRSVLARLAARSLPRARRVDGQLSDGTPLRFLVVGGQLYSAYLLSLPCAAGRPVLAGRTRVGPLRRLRERPGGDLDLCIATLPLDRALPAGTWRFRQQEFVRQVLDVSPDAAPNRRLRDKLKETERKVRRNGLSCRVSRDPGDFALFYERMFLPHTRSQFGAHADVDSREDMEAYFKRGFLVLVVQGGQPVVGALCLVENGTLVYRRMGVLDAERAHMVSGAQAAAYSFFIGLARERGCHSVDFMKSRPFLHDGVFRHKRDWGASVRADDESDTWAHHLHLGPARTLVRFYADNPAIVCGPQGLEAVVGVAAGEVVDAASLCDRYFSPGLGALLVLRDPPDASLRIPFDGAAPGAPA